VDDNICPHQISPVISLFIHRHKVTQQDLVARSIMADEITKKTGVKGRRDIPHVRE